MRRLVAVAIFPLVDDDIALTVIHHVGQTVAESVHGGKQRVTVAAAVPVEVQLHGGIPAHITHVEAACGNDRMVHVPGLDPL